MERERKFLVTRRRLGWGSTRTSGIRQGYLAIPGRNERRSKFRVRDEAGKHVLTVKGDVARSRAEIELPISGDAFRSLWPFYGGQAHRESALSHSAGKRTIELDIYRGNSAD